jgi:2,3-diketo-5-methylthio-1-phosphopentane phosphatase
MQTLIFCDFDGTISRRDVGYSLFHHFSGGRNDALLPDWKSGRMSSREVLTREAEMVVAQPGEITAYLEQFEIDTGFSSFLALCRKNRIEPVILSDGLDLYIRVILERYKLTGITVISNVGLLTETGIAVHFPRTNKSCLRCGNCKGEIIDEYRAAAGSDCRTVFVGDGYSDTCATRSADLLFAKKDLAQYCREKHIPYNGYDSFEDVASQLLRAGYLQP